MATKMEELRVIEQKIEEAEAHLQGSRGAVPHTHGTVEASTVLRHALVHCQLLRRKLEDEYEQWYRTIKRDPVP